MTVMQMDARQERSRDALIAAIIPLIAAGPLADISITALVKAAGVTRPTFYNHFPDIPATARAAAFARLDRVFPVPAPVPPGHEPTRAEIHDRILREAVPLLEHLTAERPFYVRVMEEAGTAGFFEELIEFTAARILPDEMRSLSPTPEGVALTTRFFAAGLTWMAIGWLRRQAGHDPQGMAQALAALVTSLTAERPGPGADPVQYQ